MTLDNDALLVDDPIAVIKEWLLQAKRTEINDADAIALATVDTNGHPNVRMVLLKRITNDGFFFHTNYNSKKAQEIADNAHVAFVLHWKSLRRQVRVRGQAKRASTAISDAYFATRSADSRLGAWASKQSAVLRQRQDLIDRLEHMRAQHGDNPPRPPFWGGYCVRPLSIELWLDGAQRLHQRRQWQRNNFSAPWQVHDLYP